MNAPSFTKSTIHCSDNNLPYGMEWLRMLWEWTPRSWNYDIFKNPTKRIQLTENVLERWPRILCISKVKKSGRKWDQRWNLISNCFCRSFLRAFDELQILLCVYVCSTFWSVADKRENHHIRIRFWNRCTRSNSLFSHSRTQKTVC